MARGARIAAFGAVGFIAIAGVFPALAGAAADDTPALGTYEGESTLVSFTPDPGLGQPGSPAPNPNQHAPESPVRGEVEFTCTAGGACSATWGRVNAALTKISSGHYRGRQPFEAGAGCNTDALATTFDLVFSGGSLTERVVTPAGRYSCGPTSGGSRSGVTWDFRGSLAGAPSAPSTSPETSCPQAGIFRGTSTLQSFTPAPPGFPDPKTNARPKSPASAAVLLRCQPGGELSTVVAPAGVITLRPIGAGRYHGIALYPTGCSWTPPGPTVDVDLQVAGDRVTERVETKAGIYTSHCAGSDGINKLWGVGEIRLINATRSGGPAAAGGARSGGRSASAARVAAMSSRQRDNLAAVHRGRLSGVPGSLQAPSEAFKNAGRLAQNALLAALLVLLLVFPAELFNSTFDKNHARIEAAWRKRLRRDRTTTPRPSTRAYRTIVYLVVAFAGAILAGFLDPHFGLTASSMGLLVGVIASILFGASLHGLTNREFRRARHHPADAKLVAVPAGLAVAFVCVVVSRAVHFQPGYLYGLVGGFTFAVALDRREKGRAHFVGFVVGLVAALVGWGLFAPVSHAANDLHPNFAVLVADAFLAAVFIGGIEGALFTLVPLQFLPGHHVVRWSRVAWSILAFTTAFLFVDVLLRPETGYLGKSSTASAIVTYGLFAIFGAGSVAFWAWFRFRPDPTRSAEGEISVPA